MISNSAPHATSNRNEISRIHISAFIHLKLKSFRQSFYVYWSTMLIYLRFSAHKRRPEWGSSWQMSAWYPSDDWFSYNDIQLVKLTKPYCAVPLVVDPQSPGCSCPIPFGISWFLFQIPCTASWRERIWWCKTLLQLRPPCIANQRHRLKLHLSISMYTKAYSNRNK